MIRILCLETSGSVCSIALIEQGKIVGEKEEQIENSHAKLLNVMIIELLEEIGWAFNDLSAVAVSSGPGSYTGLRIGVSTGKAICWGKDIPLIAVNSLEIMKDTMSEYANKFTYLVPASDARRNEVFLSVFKEEEEIIEVHPYILDTNPLEKLEEGDFLVFGSGAQKFEPFLTAKDSIIEGIIPLAKNMLKSVWEKWLIEDFEDVAYFEPTYFKAVHTTVSKKKFFV